MEWWEKKDKYGSDWMEDELVQHEIDMQNLKTLPIVRVKVLAEYGDNRYAHFAIETEQGYVIVFGGATRYHDALAVARGIHKAYMRGLNEERSRIKGILGL